MDSGRLIVVITLDQLTRKRVDQDFLGSAVLSAEIPTLFCDLDAYPPLGLQLFPHLPVSDRLIARDKDLVFAVAG